jgi:hypothetical protein
MEHVSEVRPLHDEMSAWVERAVKTLPPLSEAAIEKVSDVLNALALARQVRR